MFRTIRSEAGQTIWDIAIQEYGDVMMAWTILEDNATIFPDLNTDPPPNSELNIRTDFVSEDKELANYFQTEQIHINCQNA